MLFADLPRTTVDNRGGLEGARKRRRFEPIRQGRLALARIDLDLNEDGSPRWKVTSKSKSLGARVTLASGQQAGRFFWIRLTTSCANQAVVDSTMRMIKAMRACDGTPDDIRLSAIHGRTYPVEVVQYEHFLSNKIVNDIVALSPDPTHPTARKYLDLVRKLGDQVPGCRLYPASAAARLVDRRCSDRLVSEGAALSKEQLRKARNSARALERMCPAA